MHNNHSKNKTKRFFKIKKRIYSLFTRKTWCTYELLYSFLSNQRIGILVSIIVSVLLVYSATNGKIQKILCFIEFPYKWIIHCSF